MYKPLPTIPPTGRPLIRRFWASARGYWSGDSRWTAWLLTVGLIALILIQIAFQYRVNIWSRDIFDALEKKDGNAVWTQALIFVPLVVTIVALAIVAVYGRMTLQRKWREWLTNHLVGKWLANGRYYQLDLVTGDHQTPKAVSAMMRVTRPMRRSTLSSASSAPQLRRRHSSGCFGQLAVI